jgi:peptidoglycan/LPS O-acetylase OafA/YrhL
MTAGADVGSVEGAVAAGSSDSAAAYRPHLDGLRAVAVYLVVLFHAGSSAFRGGYIGVDVFFVLSGYLVTQLLLRDVQGRGSIRFGRFYARRFRRLLPAAFVALIVTAVVFTAIAAPAEVADTVGSFKAAFLYSTNWYFIHQSTGYFGANVGANPVLQFWSLAVEEQFYLVWPLAIGGVFVLTRRMDRARQTRLIQIGVAVLAVASAVWALSLRHSDPNRAYYGTDARAYELLAGALIALVPAFAASALRFRRSMRIATVVSVMALVVIGSSWVHLDAIERGIAVTLVTCVLLVAIEAADGGVVKRALSTRPAVYLGRVSYGTYLWHWLVILVIVRSFELSTISTIGITCLVATALASLSYELLEQPVRISRLLDRHRRIVIASGLAISVASALVLIPAIVTPSNASAPTATGSQTVGFTPVPASLDWQHAADGRRFVDCFHKPVARCTIVRGTGKKILLVGDSHAAMLIPTFIAIAHREHLTLAVATKGACPWQRNLAPDRKNLDAISGSALTDISIKDCKNFRKDLYTRVVPALHPDVVVAMDEDGAYTGPADDTTQSVRRLGAGGTKVVLIEDTPTSRINPRDCLSVAKVLEACRYVASSDPTELDLDYRKIAAADPSNVSSANFDRLVCPFFPICDPVVGGAIVKWDQTHLTAAFAKHIAPQVDDYLKRAGVIPR